MRDGLCAVLDRTYEAVADALSRVDDWGAPGTREHQYACDLAADAAAFEVLDAAGFGVVSEERGAHGLDRDIIVVVDPIDGTANAIRGIPYYAVSLCAVDRAGPLAALVVNLATGTRFEATRDGGARCDGVAVHASDCRSLAEATVALCGLPRAGAPWRHMRAFGATALELCDVARGALDAYVNTDDDVVAPWDYLGGLLICAEAGAVAVDGKARDLWTISERRAPQVAATAALLDEVAGYAWPSRSYRDGQAWPFSDLALDGLNNDSPGGADT